MKRSNSIYLILLAGILSTSCEESHSTKVSLVNCESHQECALPYPYCDTSSNACLSCDQVTAGNAAAGDSCVCNTECASGICRDNTCVNECESSADCHDKDKPWCENNICKSCAQLETKNIDVNDSCFCDTQCTTGICADGICAYECDKDADCRDKDNPWCDDHTCKSCDELTGGLESEAPCVCNEQCITGICGSDHKCAYECEENSDCHDEAKPYCQNNTCVSCEESNGAYGDECLCDAQCTSGVCTEGHCAHQCTTHVDCHDPNSPWCENNECKSCSQLNEQNIDVERSCFCNEQCTTGICSKGSCAYECNAHTDCTLISKPYCNNNECVPCSSISGGDKNIGDDCICANECASGICSEENDERKCSAKCLKHEDCNGNEKPYCNDESGACISCEDVPKDNLNVGDSCVCDNQCASEICVDGQCVECTGENVTNCPDYFGFNSSFVCSDNNECVPFCNNLEAIREKLELKRISCNINSISVYSDQGSLSSTMRPDCVVFCETYHLPDDFNSISLRGINYVVGVSETGEPVEITSDYTQTRPLFKNVGSNTPLDRTTITDLVLTYPFNNQDVSEPVHGILADEVENTLIENVKYETSQPVTFYISESDTGGLIGTVANSKLQNIEFNANLHFTTNTITSDNLSKIGGIIGSIINTDLDNLTFSGELNINIQNTTSKVADIGGILGNARISKNVDEHKIENLTFSGTHFNFIIDQNANSLESFGGVIGQVYEYNTLNNIHFTSTLSLTSNIQLTGDDTTNIGGVLGSVSKADSEVLTNITNITFESDNDLDLSFTAGSVANIGGIIGQCENLKFSESIFNANLHVSCANKPCNTDETCEYNYYCHNIGGVVGQATASVLNKLNNYGDLRLSDIFGEVSAVGGLVGNINTGCTLNESRVISEDAISSVERKLEIISSSTDGKQNKTIQSVGGLVGISSNSSISNSNVNRLEINIHHESDTNDKIYQIVDSVGGIVGLIYEGTVSVLQSLSVDNLSVIIAEHANYDNEDSNADYHKDIAGIIGNATGRTHQIEIADPTITNLTINAGNAAHVSGILGSADVSEIWISKLNRSIQEVEGLPVANLNYTNTGSEELERSSIIIDTLENTERDTAGVIGFIVGNETHVYISHLNVEIGTIDNVLKDGAAGVIGWMGMNGESTLLIANLNNNANLIRANAENAAGIIAGIGTNNTNGNIKSTELYNISNYVEEISANNYVGGIAGKINSSSVKVNNVQNFVKTLSVPNDQSIVAELIAQTKDITSSFLNIISVVNIYINSSKSKHIDNVEHITTGGIRFTDYTYNWINRRNNDSFFSNPPNTFNVSIALLDDESLISTNISPIFLNLSISNGENVSTFQSFNTTLEKLNTYEANSPFNVTWGTTATALKFDEKEITAPCFIDISEDIQCIKE